MSYWFYYSTDGQKQGAVTEEQLKELAANGKITPGTMLEHQSGDKTIARDVKWLTFDEAAKHQMSPPPSHVEPSPFAAASPINQTIPHVAEKPNFSVKNVIKGCGCAAGIFFGLIVIAAIFSPSPEKIEERKQQREQRQAEREQQRTEQREQREAQQNQSDQDQLKKKIERECSTMFTRILDKYYPDDFTMWQRMSATVVNVTRFDDNGYALIDARIEVDAPASLQRSGEPRIKKRGVAKFERQVDGRYFITRVAVHNGNLQFVESQYLKNREIKLDGVEIILGDRAE